MSFEVPPNVQLVKRLRTVTGLGLVEVLNALKETGYDYDKAIAALNKKTGRAIDTRSQRETREGLCESYVHVGGKIAVIVEVNCETDFVARTDIFKQFVKDICMQVAAANPKYISRDDPGAQFEIQNISANAQARSDLAPAAVGKLQQARIEEFCADYCLLDQSFIRNRDKTVRDLMNDVIAQTMENIRIRRFTRYQVGN